MTETDDRSEGSMESERRSGNKEKYNSGRRAMKKLKDLDPERSWLYKEYPGMNQMGGNFVHIDSTGSLDLITTRTNVC